MDNEKLSKIIDQSGFPLQIGIENAIQKTQASHGWNTIYREHSWINNSDNASGFIDLVLESRDKDWLAVVECKRVQNTAWLFLVSSAQEQNKRYHAKIFFR